MSYKTLPITKGEGRTLIKKFRQLVDSGKVGPDGRAFQYSHTRYRKTANTPERNDHILALNDGLHATVLVIADTTNGELVLMSRAIPTIKGAHRA